MNMGIFSKNPKSFKIDRKSSLASRLKSSISKKLVEFLGNYTDDVLAEYITVLVCNGKHQNQAREDLEAFLGKKSGEFVSWLWDLLLKYDNQENSAIGLLDSKDVTCTSSCNGNTDRDLRSNSLKKLQDSGNADSSLITSGKVYHPSTYACDPVPSGDLEVSEGSLYCKGSVALLSGVNTKKVGSQAQKSAILKEVAAAESFHDNSLMHGLFRMGGSSVIPTGREQDIQCVDKSTKIVNSNCNGLPNQLLHLPKREMISRNLQSSITEGPCAGQISAANVLARSPPRAVSAVSPQNKKSRGSVWDRLGKPCENPMRAQTIDGLGVDIAEQDLKALDQHTTLHPVLNEECSGRMKNEVSELDKRFTANKPGEYRKMEHDMTICKLNVANNIMRKRHFGEINTVPSSNSVSLVGENTMDPRYKESSEDDKISTLTLQASEATRPALVSQVQDVKKRLLQIESEMSKLRSKQLKMKKDGQPNVLPNSGAVKHSEEDVVSRTVFVTNVHFAATTEALSLCFAKCGVVLNVVILTDKLSSQPKGSAYITFANKESVDKAVALNGTSFFSRTLKVLRKADEAAATSASTHLVGKPSQGQFSQINRKTVLDRPVYASSHLQWRREPVSTPSEPSASTSNEKRVATSASYHQQQLPYSFPSEYTTQAASPSMKTPAAA